MSYLRNEANLPLLQAPNTLWQKPSPKKMQLSTGSLRVVEDSCEEAGCCSDNPPHHVAAAILSILQDLEQIHTDISKMDDLCVNPEFPKQSYV